MTDKCFIKEYLSLFKRTYFLSEKMRESGWDALEEDINWSLFSKRDIFELGLHFVANGTDSEWLEQYLSRIIEHEKDKRRKLLKTMQKEVVLAIQKAEYPLRLILQLNAYIDSKNDTILQLYCDYEKISRDDFDWKSRNAKRKKLFGEYFDGIDSNEQKTN